jgi:hypothetical protein
MMRLTPKGSAVLLAAATVVVAVAACLAPRVAQPLSYHQFADHQGWLGIANFGDVASNLPFAIAGIWGLLVLWRGRVDFIDRRECWPYLVLFVGLILTALGSGYYHLAPDNERLVWDRLPMTIGFMSLVAAIIMERIDLKAGLVLLPVLLAIGIVSVMQWHWSEARGAGDLRFYAAVQVYAVVMVLFALAMTPRYTRTFDLAIVGGFYILAKILETFDGRIFSLGQVMSGHTLKHLAAAGAGFWIVYGLTKRKRITRPAQAPGA